MMQPDILTEELAVIKKRYNMASAAAASMMQELQIPMGRDMAYTLRIPMNIDNHEAITIWILENLPEDVVIDNEIYELLKSKLIRKMDPDGHTIH